MKEKTYPQRLSEAAAAFRKIANLLEQSRDGFIDTVMHPENADPDKADRINEKLMKGLADAITILTEFSNLSENK